jgi:hypothetical protein
MKQVDRVARTPEGESEAITKAVADIIDRRAVIEQAKGVLMAVYNIDADAAFDCSSGAPNKPTPSCAPWQNN